MIVTDELLFERVLRNLIGNAVRYTEHGGILLRAKKTKKNTLVVNCLRLGLRDYERRSS